MILESIASQAAYDQLNKTQGEASMNVAKKALDASEEKGDAIVQMMEMNKDIQPHMGNSVNVFA